MDSANILGVELPSNKARHRSAVRTSSVVVAYNGNNLTVIA
jgi:hypothetical protein